MRDLPQNVLIKNWKEYDDVFRIEAVIHDGQWYTIKKWAKVALIKDLTLIEDWIRENKHILIKKGESYRVAVNEVVNWYTDKGLNINYKLVPKNYPPRIWGGITETENFITAPRRLTSYLTFSMPSPDLYTKIEKIIKPYSRIYVYSSGKVYAYTLSGEYLRDRLQKELSVEEYTKISPRIRSGFYRREVMELTDEFLHEAVKFYLAYAITILKPHKKTLDMFLPSRNDLRSQVSEWIMTAFQKFDEKEPVPFSGYLSNVLSHWPYDLPDYELGRELATFQRKRAKAVERLTKKEIENPSLEQIMEEIGEEYTITQFNELEELHDQWTKIKALQSFSHAGIDNQMETKSVFLDSEEISETERIKTKNKLAKAILVAADNSECYSECIELLNQLGKEDLDTSKLSMLSENFKSAIFTEITKRI